ncbi:MAG: hypothetical protein K2X66_11225 [Cyanobacteria bacterium]|nr:hypothetical protein [Cyanobacteriota bacterium]
MSSHNRHVAASPQFGSTSALGDGPKTADIAKLVSVPLGFLGIAGENMTLSAGMPRVVGFLDEAQQLQFTPTNSWHHQIYDGNKTPVAFATSHPESSASDGWAVGAVYSGNLCKMIEKGLQGVDQAVQGNLDHKDIHLLSFPAYQLYALKFQNPDLAFQESYVLLDKSSESPKPFSLMTKAQLETLLKSQTRIIGVSG